MSRLFFLLILSLFINQQLWVFTSILPHKCIYLVNLIHCFSFIRQLLQFRQFNVVKLCSLLIAYKFLCYFLCFLYISSSTSSAEYTLPALISFMPFFISALNCSFVREPYAHICDDLYKFLQLMNIICDLIQASDYYNLKIFLFKCCKESIDKLSK